MKPILFSTPMVQAILDGKKSMTRRVIKPQPPEWIEKLQGPEIYTPGVIDKYGDLQEGDPIYGVYDEYGEYGTRCPYKPGDILWVRETWAPCATIDSWLDDVNLYAYRANYDTTEDDSFPPSMFKWRPSIYMPREAARIFLRVTNVRVERIQEITAQDAKEEGIHEPYIASETGYETEMRGQFRDLWDSLNAKRGYGWESNPWVWVYEFERVSEDGSSKDER